MGETNRESWMTTHPETAMENVLGGALVKRAKKRHVWTTAVMPYNQWLVEGNPALNDSYPSYLVTQGDKRFTCQCQSHSHGGARNKCSHIVAVMLFKRGLLPNRNSAREVGEAERKVGEAETPELVTPEPEASPTPALHIVKDAQMDFPYSMLNDDDPPPVEMFGDNPLIPAKFVNVFPHQWEAACEIFRKFDAGEKIVIAEAPPGTGKTLLGELVRRMLDTPGLYVCTTKSLQDQFMTDFPYAKLLKGRSNYPTLDHPDRFNQTFSERLTASDCQKTRTDLPACNGCPDDSYGAEEMHCINCHPVWKCPYEIAKREALRAKQLAVINTSYFLAEVNHVGKFSGKPEDDLDSTLPHFGLVIMDEADMLEAELMSQVEVVVTAKMQERLGIGKPKHKTVESSWPAWVNDAYEKVLRAVDKLPETTQNRTLAREKKSIEQLHGKLSLLRKEIVNGGWVYDGYNSKRGDIIFRPIRVDKFGQDMIWKHGPRFLLMSGSFIDPQAEMDYLGMEAV